MKDAFSSARSLAMGELTLTPIAGQSLMVVQVEGSVGSVAPAHSHPHEQMTLVEKGRLRFIVGGEQTELQAGEILRIPGDTEHEAELLEDSTFYDIFHPVRRELLDSLEGGG